MDPGALGSMLYSLLVAFQLFPVVFVCCLAVAVGLIPGSSGMGQVALPGFSLVALDWPPRRRSQVTTHTHVPQDRTLAPGALQQ